MMSLPTLSTLPGILIIMAAYFVFHCAVFWFYERVYTVRRPLWLTRGLLFVVNGMAIALLRSLSAYESVILVALGLAFFLELSFIYGEGAAKCTLGSLMALFFLATLRMLARSALSLALAVPYHVTASDWVLNLYANIAGFLLCSLALYRFNLFVSWDELSLIHSGKKNVSFLIEVLGALCVLVLYFSIYLYVPDNHTVLSVLGIKTAVASLAYYCLAVRYSIWLFRKQLFKEKVLTLEEKIELHQNRQNELRSLALIDQMTRCANREHCEKLLNDLYASNRCFSISFLDLDGLKMVNDRYGHGEGDRYILAFVNLLQNVMHTGVLCRYGGDEFIAVFPDETEYEVVRAMFQMEAAVDTINRSGQFLYELSVSWGAVECSPKHKRSVFRNVDMVIEEADRRMYQYKKLRKKQR